MPKYRVGLPARVLDLYVEGNGLQVLPYPEDIKELPFGELEVEVSLPEHWHVVMGASGKAAREVHESAMVEADVPLYKRKGGGGTVLLGPGTLIVTVHAGVAHTFRNMAYFEAINKALMDVFRHWKPLDYAQKGISDIAVGPKKIVGSSIFRRRQYVLYQASVLLDLNLPLMERLLQYPPREPDYRKGRSHADFVTSLHELGVETESRKMLADMESLLPDRLRTYIDEVDKA